MKTLERTSDVVEIQRRIAALQGDEDARFGRMTVGQMICHLGDSFEFALGERTVQPMRLPIPRGMFKWLALKVPFQWSPGFRTLPELEQGYGGTVPGVFEEDRGRLTRSVERFVGREGSWVEHPFFGPMSRQEWMRWGYLHANHHLRQFGR